LFTEGDFGAVDFLAGVVEGKFIAGSLCGGRSSVPPPIAGLFLRRDSDWCNAKAVHRERSIVRLVSWDISMQRASPGLLSVLAFFSELLNAFLPRTVGFGRSSEALTGRDTFKPNVFRGQTLF
jgi:hypothetical protein